MGSTVKVIYGEPVCYGFTRITVSTALVTRQANPTIAGRAQPDEDAKNSMTNIPWWLQVQKQIKHPNLKEMSGAEQTLHIKEP